jgi:hypothetical protein
MFAPIKSPKSLNLLKQNIFFIINNSIFYIITITYFTLQTSQLFLLNVLNLFPKKIFRNISKIGKNILRELYYVLADFNDTGLLHLARQSFLYCFHALNKLISAITLITFQLLNWLSLICIFKKCVFFKCKTLNINKKCFFECSKVVSISLPRYVKGPTTRANTK